MKRFHAILAWALFAASVLLAFSTLGATYVTRRGLASDSGGRVYSALNAHAPELTDEQRSDIFFDIIPDIARDAYAGGLEIALVILVLGFVNLAYCRHLSAKLPPPMQHGR